MLTTDIAAAAAALARGRLVAFATETVYGLGADAANAAAVAALYRAKNRPPAHPVILHLASFAAAGDWAHPIPPAAAALAERFMPGPLTLLLPRRKPLPHLPGSPLIAVRVPAHPLAQLLLQTFGGGVVAPSANRFGGLSPTSAHHVAAEFADQDELLILDGGDCTVGIESTIAGFQGGSAFIVRPGDISAEMIAASGVDVITASATPAAPGTLARHYAPKKPLWLVEEKAVAAHLTANSPAAGLLSPQAVRGAALWRQAAAAPAQYAHELYRHLRELDEAAVERILVVKPPATAAWRAINDRLQRAAAACRQDALK